MEQIKKIYNNLKVKFENLIQKKYFLEIYCGIIALIAFVGWLIGGAAGVASIIASGIIVLLLTGTINYIIPQILYLIFTISDSFYSFYDDTVSFVVLAIIALIFVIILAISVFKQGIKLKKYKSIIPLIGLAVFNILPIFWCNSIGDVSEYQIFYIYYFSNLLYLAIYFILCTGIKGNAIEIFTMAASFLGLLISFECAVMVIKFRDAADSILELWYSVGWGLCNEAGIMICFALPFIFYLVSKQTTYKGIIYQLAKSLICLVGILLTTSRGGFLIGALIFAASIIALLFISADKKKYRRLFLIAAIATIAMCLILIVPLIKVASKVIDSVFFNGLELNGRDEIWTTGFNCWTQNAGTVIFGPGWCCAIEPHEYTTNGIDRPTMMCPTVFHSLLMHTLCVGGLIALGFLIYHMILKYKSIAKFTKPFMISLYIGFIALDIYGLIDNTYHMFYFMVPLALLLAVLDNAIYNKDKEERPSEIIEPEAISS